MKMRIHMINGWWRGRLLLAVSCWLLPLSVAGPPPDPDAVAGAAPPDPAAAAPPPPPPPDPAAAAPPPPPPPPLSPAAAPPPPPPAAPPLPPGASPEAGPGPGPGPGGPPPNPAARCRLSEFACSTVSHGCIPTSKFCDQVNDCGDGSDEPRGCTPCNRTYYGDVGRTYELELHRPREDSLPFVCQLSFVAGGGNYGDLVQLTFDSFTLGRFVSFTTDGCPDGALSIAEAARPTAGGAWCGPSWAPAVYYSETSALTVSLRLARLPVGTGYNFDLRIAFRTLPASSAWLRFGGGPRLTGILDPPPASSPPLLNTTSFDNELPSEGSGSGDGERDRERDREREREEQERELERARANGYGPDTPREPVYYLGDLIQGTYCSRIFSDCDKRACRLQSPNFPGVYPRNLTCYYAVRQHEVPPGKQALIAVRQPRGQLVSIRSRAGPYPNKEQQQEQQQERTTGRQLRVWQECDEVQDYVTVFDGYTTRDPVLLRFCGGGVAVPEAVSSGPELLVEFTSAPFGTFLYPASPFSVLHGFQLEVEVRFVPAQSATYARHKQCVFWLRGPGRGVLEAPRHSLPRGATCLYHLLAPREPPPPPPPPGLPLAPPLPPLPRRPPQPPRYRIWLSVLKFHVAPPLPSVDDVAQASGPQGDDEDCTSQLRLWDGSLAGPAAAELCNDVFCEHDKDKVRFPAGVGSNGGGGSGNDGSNGGTSGGDLNGSGASGGSNAKSPAAPDPAAGFNPLGSGGENGGGGTHGGGGGIDLGGFGGVNASWPNQPPLLARFCRGGRTGGALRSCDHALLPGRRRVARPCHAPRESFLSSGDAVTVEMRLDEATALRPVSFRALFEFVDLRQDGEPIPDEPGPCARRFVSRPQQEAVGPLPPREFHSPRDVFLFGRGGAKNLSCLYRFEAQRGERVKLVITSLKTAGRPCVTEPVSEIGRLGCRPITSNFSLADMGVGGGRFGSPLRPRVRPPATLRLFERPWRDAAPLPRDCLCGKPPLPFTWVSAGAGAVELRFTAPLMTPSEDASSLAFAGTWQFIRTPACTRQQRRSGPSGEIRFRSPSRTPEEVNCENHPYLIEPRPGRYLYVKLRGVLLPHGAWLDDVPPGANNSANASRPSGLPSAECATRNRIAVQAGSGASLLVCPVPSAPARRHHIVEVFSEGWATAAAGSSAERRRRPPKDPKLVPGGVLVEFLGHEPGAYSLTWLELSRSWPHATTMEELSQCPHRCPELDACINASLWCDGVTHCPSGADEAARHCSLLFTLPPLYLALAALCLLLLLLAAAAVAFAGARRCRRRAHGHSGLGGLSARGRRRRQRLAAAAAKGSFSSSGASSCDPGSKEVIC